MNCIQSTQYIDEILEISLPQKNPVNNWDIIIFFMYNNFFLDLIMNGFYKTTNLLYL